MLNNDWRVVQDYIGHLGNPCATGDDRIPLIEEYILQAQRAADTMTNPVAKRTLRQVIESAERYVRFNKRYHK